MELFLSLNAFNHAPTSEQLLNISAVMEVYVINMAQSAQRWAYIQHYLQQKGLEPTRVDAVNGRALSPAECLMHYDENLNDRHYFSSLKAAEIGCFLSHKKAMETFLAQSNKPYLLLLEDDIEFCFNIASAAPSWFDVLASPIPTMLKLYTKRSVLGGTEGFGVCGQIVRPYLIPLGTPAQVLNRAAVKKLLLLCERFFMPVDVAYQYWWKHGVRVLVASPSQVREISQSLDGSSIGGTIGLTQRQKILREIGRSWFRLKLQVLSYWHYFKTRII